MGIHSGKFGVINSISNVRSWSLTTSMNTNAQYASNTKGGALRRKGVQDWNGSFVQSGLAPSVMPGEAFAFAGLTAPSNGEEGGEGFVYSGNAIVDSISVVWNWETAEPIVNTVNFSGNGALIETTGSYADEANPVVPYADDATKIELIGGAGGSGSGGDDEICGAKQATLNISAANQAYVNSCTGGWTGREAGPIDWNLAVVLDESDPSNAPWSKGDYCEFKIYVTATYYWHLKWGLAKDISNLTVDRESGAIVGFTGNFDMSSHDETPMVGIIQLPNAGTAWWPA